MSRRNMGLALQYDVRRTPTEVGCDLKLNDLRQRRAIRIGVEPVLATESLPWNRNDGRVPLFRRHCFVCAMFTGFSTKVIRPSWLL